MALTYSGTCPHCIKENVAMAYKTHLQRPTRTGTNADRTTIIDVLFTCNNCRAPVLVNYECANTHKQLPENMTGDLNDYWKYISIRNVWPKLEKKESPKHIPVNVERFLQQGFINFKAQHFDAAGAMARKALEAALVAHSPNLADGSLYQRINKLKENGVLTESLADWAHNVRLLGNDAVHDLEPADPVDVNQALQLAEYLLIYLFTLPTEIKLAKESAQPPADKE